MSYIDETGLAEVTTKLKTYIDNKAGGGSGVPSNMGDSINYFLTPITNNTRYTQNALTLFTPNASFTKYFIRKNTLDNKYQIFWVYSLDNPLLGQYTTNGELRGIAINYPDSDNTSISLLDTSVNMYWSLRSVASNNYPYSSVDTYNTLSDAIVAMQNPNTLYQVSSLIAVRHDLSELPYSNISKYINQDVWQIPRNISATSITKGMLVETPKISDNETIEVIQ